MASIAKVQNPISRSSFSKTRRICEQSGTNSRSTGGIAILSPGVSQTGYRDSPPNISFSIKRTLLLSAPGEKWVSISKTKTRLFQQEYENAIFATSGKPHWESYRKGKKICPTDFIDFKAADEKSSGQGIIFGTKPMEILIPYIKVLTKRDDLVVEPFSGSGTTLIAAEKMDRRCHRREKSPVYAEVIRTSGEKITGKRATKL